MTRIYDAPLPDGASDVLQTALTIAYSPLIWVYETAGDAGISGTFDSYFDLWGGDHLRFRPCCYRPFVSR